MRFPNRNSDSVAEVDFAASLNMIYSVAEVDLLQRRWIWFTGASLKMKIYIYEVDEERDISV